MKKKRVLMTATVPSMIGQFNINNIKLLLNMDYEVDVACDFTDTSVWPFERTQKFKNQMAEMGVECIQLNFSRSPLKFSRHWDSYKEILSLIQNRDYAFIHTHTPISSAVVRLAARKTGTKVIYTAHGFHFYKGAPLKNWLFFYPIEKFLSKYTDVLITINKEDYNRATEKFHAKKTAYVPGVGIDIEKFAPKQSGLERVRTETNLREIKSIDFSMEREKHGFCENQGTLTERQQKRIEIGVPLDAKLLISVGELSTRKNHKVVVQALQELPENYWYIIVGKGSLKDELESIDHTGRLKLLGYRTDIAELLQCSDVFVFPSLQEGLPVALMEAMASGLPVACSKIRGNVDLIDDDDCLFKPTDAKSIEKAIRYVLSQNSSEMAARNLEAVRKFSLKEVSCRMEGIYQVGHKG